MNISEHADKLQAQIQQLAVVIPDIQSTSTTLFERVQELEKERCKLANERRSLHEEHQRTIQFQNDSHAQQKSSMQSQIDQSTRQLRDLMQQLECAKREKAKLEEHVAFQARSFAEECIKIHKRSVQEAEQQALEALQHERMQHSRELETHAAELALLRKQAEDCQQKLTEKEVQLSDLHCRLDESSALLERLPSGQETAREPQQELTARDARIADLTSKLEAAMSYRKKYVALGKECRQLQDNLLQQLDAATERAEVAEARAEAAEARAAEAVHVERENFKIYLRKKDRMYKEMESELEDCKQRMRAHGLELPGHRMPQNEEEQKSDWDPDICEEDGTSATLPTPGGSQHALPQSSEHGTSSAAATAAATSAMPSTESEASQPDDANCCTVVYQPAGPAAEAEHNQRQHCSIADPGTEEKSAGQIPGSSTPSSANSAPQEGLPEQNPMQTSKQTNELHMAKRINAACRPESSPKRQKTEGVLQNADLNTLVASQDSTEAMQTAGACPRDADNDAEANLSATQLTMVTRQRHSHPAQDSQNDSENIECTPQSSRAPLRRSRPSPALPQPAEQMPQGPAQEQDAAAACAPGSPAWQVKSRERQESTAQAPGQHDVSLHLSQLLQPARREAAAAPEPAGRPNPFRADGHARAYGARPPPKWHQKQKGPALPDALAFLDLRQTQQAGARATQHLPTIVERHAETLHRATAPAPPRRPPDNQPQFRPGEPGYKYKETVRKKAEREELMGIECVDCRNFYAAIETWGAVGNLPACGHAVRGAGAPPATAAAQPVREQLRQDASRHRYRYEPPATPDGFWDLGFMDSLDSRVQPQNYGGKEDGACS